MGGYAGAEGSNGADLKPRPEDEELDHRESPPNRRDAKPGGATGKRDAAPHDRSRAGEEEDQARSDSDQALSDIDQTSSAADQSAAERDQLASDADERSAKRDQRTADRDLAENPSEAARDAHLASEEARQHSGMERQAAGLDRRQTASDRDRRALARDAEARDRDAISAARDRRAEARDRETFEAVRQMEIAGEGCWEDAAQTAAKLRADASSDRAHAAEDRDRAASDRGESALDRDELHAALEASHLDGLTGAFRRGIGEMILRSQLQRAQREKLPLTLAMIDADNLKAINDGQGHAAGDAMLCDIVNALRAKLRPYDPLVRTGGDEFVCTLAGSTLEVSRQRVVEVSAALAKIHPEATISVGLAQMRSEDTLEALLERGDAALYQRKRAD